MQISTQLDDHDRLVVTDMQSDPAFPLIALEAALEAADRDNCLDSFPALARQLVSAIGTDAAIALILGANAGRNTHRRVMLAAIAPYLPTK